MLQSILKLWNINFLILRVRYPWSTSKEDKFMLIIKKKIGEINKIVPESYSTVWFNQHKPGELNFKSSFTVCKYSHVVKHTPATVRVSWSQTVSTGWVLLTTLHRHTGHLEENGKTKGHSRLTSDGESSGTIQKTKHGKE